MKLKKQTSYKFVQIIILVLLFLGTMNLGNLYFYFLFGASLISIFINFRSLKVNWMVPILFVFSFLYILFDPHANSNVITMIKQLLFPMCYLLGLNFLYKKEDSSNNEKQISVAISVCSLGALIHYLLNLMINFTSLSRNTVDFWTGEVVTATVQAGLAVMALGVFSSWLFNNGKKRIIALIGIILILVYNMVLAGRTLILLTVMSIGISFIYSFNTIRNKKKGKLLIYVGGLVLIALVAYAENWGGVRDFILGSNFSARFDAMDISHDGRLENKKLYLRYMLKYPLGGGKLRDVTGEFAHDLYLDVCNDAGILACVLVVLFSGQSFYKAFSIVRKGNVGNDFKLLILCIYLILFVEFMLEPIMRGMPWMFYIFCFFSGLIQNVQITNRETKKEGGML